MIGETIRAFRVLTRVFLLAATRCKVRFVVPAALFAAVFGVLLTSVGTATAAQTVPYKVNFQGRLTNSSGNIMADGLYNMKFRIWTASSGGSNSWEELRESSNRVQVTNGLFSVQLGDVTALSPSLFTSQPLYFEVELPTPATATCSGASCATWTEGAMTPRRPLGASPYAMNADTLDGLDATAFVQLSPGSPQSGAVDVTGNIKSGGQLQGNTLDAATSGALTIGSANATSISLAKNTSLGAALTLTLQGTNALQLGSTTAAGGIVFNDGTVNARNVTLTTAGLGASYSLTLPTTAPGLSQCLKSGTSTAGLMEFGSCGTGSAAADLSNLTATSINQSLVADTNSSRSLGSAAKVWQNIYTGNLDAGSTTTALTVGTAATTTAITIGRSGFAVSLPGGITTSNGTINTGNGSITTTGSIGGGAITGSSLSAGSGSISTTGGVSGGSITASNSAAGALTVSGAPTAVSTASLIQLGSAITGGNAVANGGTYFGANIPGSGAGSAADFLNFQLAGAVKLKVDNSGAMTLGAGLTIASGTAITVGSSAGQTATACGAGSYYALQAVTGGIITGGSCTALPTNAATDLSNLTATSINQDLVGASNNARSVGSAAKVMQNVYTGNLDAGSTTTALTIGTAATTTAITIGRSGFAVSLPGGITTSNGTINTGNGSITTTGSIGGGAITGSSLSAGSGSISTTGGVSGGSVTASGSAAGALTVSGAPTAVATASLIQLGSAIAGGNAVANGGTYFGANIPGSGAGTAADFLNFQKAGAVKLKVDNAGAMTLGAGLTIASGSVITVGASAGLTTAACGAGSYYALQQVSGGVIVGGSCTALPTNAATDLSNLTATSISTALVANTNNSVSFGSAAKVWQNVYTGNLDTGTTTTTLTVGTAATTTAVTVGRSGFAVSLPGGITTSNGSIDTGNGAITTTGTITGNLFSGSGASLTSLNATNLATGSGAVTLQSAGASSLSIVSGTGGMDIGDNAITKTIDIGGVTASGTDTVNIATNGTAADTVTIGSTNAASKLILQGGVSTTTSGTAGVIIGSATADGNQINLQLDSSTTLAETASTCSTTVNQGAMYYNTASNAIRSCINANWEDVMTTAGMGIITFGIVPDSTATTGTGDLAGANGYNSGPCKVYVTASQNIVGWNSCIAYSSGRKFSVASGTATVSSSTGVYQNLCLNTSGVPALVGTANATESTTALYPTFSVGAPVLCLAEIKTASVANKIAAIYDTRVYTTSTKTFAALATVTTTTGLGSLIKANGTIGQYAVTTAATEQIFGVLVAYSGTTSTALPNAVIVTAGPVAIKASAGTIALPIQWGAAGGYGATVALATTATNPYVYAGIAQNSYSGVAAGCTASTVCNGSLFTTLTIR